MTTELEPVEARPTQSDAPPLHRFSVDEYERMIELGILRAEDRVELLDGVIFEMSPIGSRHAAMVAHLDETLRPHVGAGFHLRLQSPIQLGASEPQPDLAIARGRGRDYVAAHPGPRELALVIEVAETSAEHDRTRKQALYAQAGIPEFWILDLEAERLEGFADPRPATANQPARYASRVAIDSRGCVDLRLDGRVVTTFPVGELLP